MRPQSGKEKGGTLRYRPPICGRFKTPAKLFTQGFLRSLLEFDGAAGSFDLGFDVFGFCLVDAFLDSLWSCFDQCLGFGQAEAGDGTDFLDHLDLLAAVARQDDVEFGLLFSSLASCSGWAGNSNSCSGANAPGFFQCGSKFSRLKDGQLRKFFYKFGDIGHDLILQI